MSIIKRHELHSLQIEQRVLEVLMSRSDAYDEYSDLITLDMFFANRHQLIYRAIASLKKTASAEELDPILVRDRLEQVGKLQEAGGEDYLMQVLDMPHLLLSARLDEHIATLEDLRLRREMSDKLQDSIAELANRETSAVDVLHKCVDSMVNVSTGNVESKTDDMNDLLTAMMDEIDYIKEHGVTFMETGFAELDNVIMPDAGNQWVIAGRPSMGKTVLAENVVRHIVKTTGKAGVIFSLEMQKTDMTRRMVSAEGTIPIHALKQQDMGEENYSRMFSTVATIKDMNMHVNDDRSITMSGIKTELARIYRQHGDIGVVMIDYLQIMKEVIEAGNDKHNKIAEVSRGLRALAQQYNCLMILLSQVNRQCESRPDKRPHMGDLKESSAIEQDADIITMVFRQDKYRLAASEHDGVVEVIVAKNRNGTDRTIRLSFEGQYSRFSNLMPNYAKDDIPNYGEQA